jgi:DNA polymerase-1
MQLVSPGVGLFNPNDKTETIWTQAEVVARTGVNPAQIVDWLSLIGDSVDNIPGVPGIGPKTAAELLGQFGTIHALYSRLAEIKSEKLRGALQDSERVVTRNQEMIRLNDQVEGEFRLTETRVRTPAKDRLRELYARWGFHSLLRELEPAQSRQAELF